MELFAGIGGFRVGLEAAGGTCVFASEISPQVSERRHGICGRVCVCVCARARACILFLCVLCPPRGLGYEEGDAGKG